MSLLQFSHSSSLPIRCLSRLGCNDVIFLGKALPNLAARVQSRIGRNGCNLMAQHPLHAAFSFRTSGLHFKLCFFFRIRDCRKLQGAGVQTGHRRLPRRRRVAQTGLRLHHQRALVKSLATTTSPDGSGCSISIGSLALLCGSFGCVRSSDWFKKLMQLQ